MVWKEFQYPNNIFQQLWLEPLWKPFYAFRFNIFEMIFEMKATPFTVPTLHHSTDQTDVRDKNKAYSTYCLTSCKLWKHFDEETYVKLW